MASEAVEHGAVEGAGGAVVEAGVGVVPTHKQMCVVGGLTPVTASLATPPGPPAVRSLGYFSGQPLCCAP